MLHMLPIKSDEKIELPSIGSWPKTVHVFDENSIWAISAALAAERPLLVRGEPGTGKSQLARAAALVLNRIFISEVVHAKSECQDLQWHFDAVGRLGEAQALGAAGKGQDVADRLDPLRFLCPGPLWWTFDWESAKKQYEKCNKGIPKPIEPKGWTSAKGSVLLIDEIDKAEADLPNGLLETLGNGAFPVPYFTNPIGLVKGAPPPLVVITTNEERELPAAFLRRCMVLHLDLPDEEHELIDWLVIRGNIHFGDQCSEKVRRKAAEQLWTDRRDALHQGIQAPGQAEYLDMLRAVTHMSHTEQEQSDIFDKIHHFALVKYPRERK